MVLDDVAALDELIARHAARGARAPRRGGPRDPAARRSPSSSIATTFRRKVVINEAVELAKRYGAADSFKFVNAVLDKTARELRSDAARRQPADERMIGEFEIIARYFTRPDRDADVVLGVGDDAAVLAVDGLTAVTVDTLVAGVHFPDGMAPNLLGYRLMAVNLSDLAAMGAEPRWCTLALTLPKPDERWLEGFSRGLVRARRALRREPRRRRPHARAAHA